MALGAWATCGCAHLPLEGEIARVVAGLSFVIVGAIALSQHQRGRDRVGSLMVAVGLTWFIDDLGWIYQPVPYTFSRLGLSAFQPLLAHLVLAFPGGYLRTRVDRVLVTTCYCMWLVESVASMLFWDPRDAGCPRCPQNLLLLDRDAQLAGVVEQIGATTVLILTGIVVVRVIVRWREASAVARRALAPVLWAAVPLSAAVAIYSIVGRSLVPPLAPLGMTALPIGFLIGLLRVHLTRADVGRLVVELGRAPPPGQLRDALARTLRDPSLQVVYWVNEPRTFVDAMGTPTPLPRPGSGRAATLLERDGEVIAALIHDHLLDDDPTLIEAAAAAARLAIDNERLQAEIRAQLQEVHASRARIVQAADVERRRIERNLHDGSQQRLVALSLALGRARARSATHEDAELTGLLQEASDELVRALAELRELARGIHPALLTEAGLGPALRALARRSALPVTVVSVPEERLAEAVEAAAYFVVAEALANTTKYAAASSASVSVERQAGFVRVEVVDDGIGGADPGAGSGLQGLTDRVGALDGRLEVVSPPGVGTRVVACIPCE